MTTALEKELECFLNGMQPDIFSQQNRIHVDVERRCILEEG